MDADVVVVGAGVVGLAVAAAVAAPGRGVLVLERHGAWGLEATGRNSGVVHAGLHHAPETLRARLCVDGNPAVFERCGRLGLPHRRTGKLVVATSSAEVLSLEAMLARGREAGVPGLELWDGARAAALEPRVRAAAALWSPSSGLVDPLALAGSFLDEARSRGARLLVGAEVVAVEPAAGGGLSLAVRGASGSGERVFARQAVLSAGVHTDRLLERSGLDPDAVGARTHAAQGDWFALSARWDGAVSRPVYPLPPSDGSALGVHLTPDLSGRLRLGPDARPVPGDRPEAPEVDPGRAVAFLEAARPYLPGLALDDLRPDAAGVRARLSPPGAPARDFVVADLSAQGLPGAVLLAGIESPGLTAAPALARLVAEMLDG